METSKITKTIGGDKVIWMVVLLLSVVSILAVYSSTSILAHRFKQGNTEYYLLKHLSILGLGFLLMYVTHLVPFKYFGQFSPIALPISILLLIAVWIFGTTLFDAKRYLVIPIINLSFQPSDFAKLTLIVYLSWMLSRSQEYVNDRLKMLFLIIIPSVVVTAIIFPSNFSTAAIIFATSLTIMFIARVNLPLLGMVLGVLIGLAALFMVVAGGSDTKKTAAVTEISTASVETTKETGKVNRVPTWKKRLKDFISGDEKTLYQITHSKIAIAEGGVPGKGPGNSIQKNWLPQAFSDFIYAIIIEEYGLIGGSFVLLLYLILLFRGLRIATKSRSLFGTILAIGLTLSLAFQAMINLGVTVGLLPTTGQPLPLVSMGGTSLWFTSIAIGIILSIGRYVDSTESTEEAYA